jgi:hypothetical protein
MRMGSLLEEFRWTGSVTEASERQEEEVLRASFRGGDSHSMAMGRISRFLQEKKQRMLETTVDKWIRKEVQLNIFFYSLIRERCVKKG